MSKHDETSSLPSLVLFLQVFHPDTSTNRRFSPNSLTSADVPLVTMVESVEGLCVSSKFYTALTRGQAVLSIADPEAEIARTVEETKCGIHVGLESLEDIATAVRTWFDPPELPAEMGNKARDLFESSFSKDVAIERYDELLRTI